MKQHLSYFFVLLLFFSGAAQAFNGPYAPANQSRENPVDTIQNALEKLQQFSANKDNANPALLGAFIEQQIIPHFDFEQMTRWVAGPFLRHMSTEDLQQLEARVKKTFLNSLDKHLSTYNASTTRFNMRRAQYRGPDQATVATLLFSQNQPPVRLDFRMRADGNSWKIVDISANGMSAAHYYRKQFLSTLKQYRYNR